MDWIVGVIAVALFGFIGYRAVMSVREQRAEERAYELKRPSTCGAQRFSDSMVCKTCNLTWDVNDAYAPPCLGVGG